MLVDSQGTSSACLGVWHPLIASSGGTPCGEGVSLGTVKRPEGTVQVTYKGTPLYTFTGDQQPGETEGQGITGYLTVPPDALIAYHVPPNAFTPT
jgi:predicted lipoprotein with Yx(FWY)xxD motif